MKEMKTKVTPFGFEASLIIGNSWAFDSWKVFHIDLVSKQSISLLKCNEVYETSLTTGKKISSVCNHIQTLRILVSCNLTTMK